MTPSPLRRKNPTCAELLKILADDTRLEILKHLKGRALCVFELNERIPIERSLLSHHLKVLREAGWIQGERRGTWIWYSIRPQAVERLGAIAGAIQAGGARPAATLGPATAAAEARDLPVLQADWRQW